MGLSFKGASVSKQEPVFDLLMRKRLVQKNIFSLFLTQSAGKDGSVLLLGGTDHKYYLDDITFFPVESPYVFWMLNVSHIGLRDGQFPASSPGAQKSLVSLCDYDTNSSFGCRAVIDSGTSLISGPSKAIKKLTKFIRVDPTCHGIDELPVLQIQFYDKVYSLQPDDYVMKVARSPSPCSNAACSVISYVCCCMYVADSGGQHTRLLSWTETV